MSSLYYSQYVLSDRDAWELNLTSSYGLHTFVCGLFDRTRNADATDHSGILFADKSGIAGRRGAARCRHLVILSTWQPHVPRLGVLTTRSVPEKFFRADVYRFACTVNAVCRMRKTGRHVPLRDSGEIGDWFRSRAPQWGFSLWQDSSEVKGIVVDTFKKGSGTSVVTLSKALLSGVLKVTNREAFIRSVRFGIGRGRAYGCGLLEISPLS
ncbi:MAG: type I-E CRISPR-associated protein Cas6/Cse3/CasE [Desulfovibrionaceae bacterium]|nr:type I-E CRISPR-associated protein Cas6/Cse3/CasE [Desulfovibrionaceae bacterium]